MSSIGNTLKTTMSRISRSSSADPDVSASDRSKASKAYAALGIDLYNDKGEYQDLSVTLDELSKKWNTLTDAQRNYIAEQSAGTRGINVFTAMMDNYQEAMKLADSAVDDDNFYKGVQEKYENTIQAHQEKASATLQGVWNQVLGSGTVNGVLDVGTGFLNVITGAIGGIDKISHAILGFNDNLAGAVTGITLITGVMSAWSSADFIKNKDFAGAAKNMVAPLSSVFEFFVDRDNLSKVKSLKATGKTTKEAFAEIGGISSLISKTGVGKMVDGFRGVKDLMADGVKFGTAVGTTSGIEKVGGVAGGLAGLAAANPLAMIGGTIAVGTIAAIVAHYMEENNRPAKNKESYEDYSQQYQSLNKRREFASSIAPEYTRLSKGVNVRTGENISLSTAEYQRFSELQSQIADMFPEVISGYNAMGGAIVNSSTAISKMNDLLNTQATELAHDNIDKNKYEYLKQWRKQAEDTQKVLGIKTTNGIEDANKEMMTETTRGAVSQLKVLKEFQKKTKDEVESEMRVMGNDLDEFRLLSSDSLGARSKMSDDEFANFQKNLSEQIIEKTASLQDASDQMKSIAQSAIEIQRYSADRELGVTDKTFDQLQSFFDNLTLEGMSELFNKNMNIEDFVNGLVDSLAGGKSGFQEAFNELMTKNFSDMSLKSIEEFYKGQKLQSLSEMMGLEKDTILDAVGLKDVKGMLDHQDKIVDKYNEAVTKQTNSVEQSRKLEEKGYSLDNLQKRWDGTYMGMASNGLKTAVYSPYDKNGKMIPRDEMMQIVEDAFNGKDNNRGVTTRIFDGANHRGEANNYLKYMKSNGKMLDKSNKAIRDLIGELGIRNEKDLSNLDYMLDKYKNADDILAAIKKNWKADTYDHDAELQRLENLRQNLTAVSQGYDDLHSAMTESYGATGMSKDSVDAVDGMFADLKGYDYNKLFEGTAMGIRMNQEALRSYYAEYKKAETAKYENEIQSLTQTYQDLCKQINATTDASERMALVDKLGDVRGDITTAQELQSQFEGYTNGIREWQSAVSGGEKGDIYDSLASSGIKGAKERYENYEIGSNEFRAFTNLLVNKDLTDAGVQEVVDAYENNVGTVERWVKEDAWEGIQNFVKDMQAVNKDFVKDLGDHEYAINSNGLYTFDEMAKSMDIDPALLQTMFDKMSELGADIHFDETTDHLAEMRKGVAKTAEGFSEASKAALDLENFDWNPEKLSDLDKSIDKVSKLRDSMDKDSKDYEIASSMLDYLGTLRGEKIAVGIEMENPEIMEKFGDTVEAFKKKYKIEAEIDFTSDDSDYLNDRLRDVYEKVRNAGGIKKDSETYEQDRGVVEQLIKKRNEAQDQPEWYTTDKLDRQYQANAQQNAQRVRDASQRIKDLQEMRENGIEISDKEFEEAVKSRADAYRELMTKTPKGYKDLKEKFGLNTSDLFLSETTGEEVDKTFSSLQEKVSSIQNDAEKLSKIKKLFNVDLAGVEDVESLMERICSMTDTLDQYKLFKNLGLDDSQIDALMKLFDPDYTKKGYERKEREKEYADREETNRRHQESKTSVDTEDRPNYVRDYASIHYRDGFDDKQKERFRQNYGLTENMLTGSREHFDSWFGKLGINKQMGALKALDFDEETIKQTLMQFNPDVKLNPIIDATEMENALIAGDYAIEVDAEIDDGALNRIKGELSTEQIDAIVRFTADASSIDGMNIDEVTAVVRYMAESGQIEGMSPEEKDAFVDYLANSPAIDGVSPEEKEAFVKYTAQSGLIDGEDPERVEAFATAVVDDIKDPEQRAQVKGEIIEIINNATPPSEPVKMSGEITNVTTPEGQTLTMPINYKTGTVEELPEQKGTGTVDWKNNSAAVEAYAATTKTGSGTVVWGNDTSGVKSSFTATGTVQWTNAGGPGKGGHDADGTAHFNGSAHAAGTAFAEGTSNDGFFKRFKNAIGSAFSSGNWGAKKTEMALTGELGPELVVSSGGKWHLVGEKGAEFTKIRQGDIIFNHKQTRELFENGFVTSNKGRGRLFGYGGKDSAHANGTAYIHGSTSGTIKFNRTKYSQQRIAAATPAANQQQAQNINRAPVQRAQKEAEGYKETIDWIEVALDRIQRKINQLDTLGASVFEKFSDRQKNMADEFAKVTEEIDLQSRAYDKYMEKANSIGLPADYLEKVKSGQIAIEDITDEDLHKKIQEASEWANKAYDCSDALVELKEKLGEIAKAKFDAVTTEFDQMVESIQHNIDMIDGQLTIIENRGNFAGKAYYEELVKQEESALSKLQDQYIALQDARNDAIWNGSTIEGSEADMEMLAQINEVESAWQEATNAILEYKNAYLEMDTKAFSWINDQIGMLHEESQFIQELLSIVDNNMFVKKTGRLNDKGMAVGALHAMDYAVYSEQAQKYKEKVEELNKALEKDPYNTILIDARNEYLKLQRESIQAANDEKKAIRELISESYNRMLEALQKLINKRKEELQAQKDYEYSPLFSVKRQCIPFNCWKTLKIFKPKQKDEISLNGTVMKIEKIEYMEYGAILSSKRAPFIRCLF